MTESELKQAFEQQKPILLSWGEMVCETVVCTLQTTFGVSNVNNFLKVPATPRVKDTESFLAKALRRGKKYSRPLDEITDRVGIRFVVLLRSEIPIISRAIESSTLWDWQKDRDFEAERIERPHHFDYQSLHYVVRATHEIQRGSCTIPAGIPCEVQVRTLLQHAYAELSHDRTYKASREADLDVLRQVAKSAALVETTDEIFVAVNKKLEEASAEIRRVHQLAQKAYLKSAGIPATSGMGLTNELLDPYRDKLKSITPTILRAFLKEHGFIADKIRERSPLSTLYRHPCVVVLYFLVQNHPDLVAARWPFDKQHLEMIYTDLGLSADGRL